MKDVTPDDLYKAIKENTDLWTISPQLLQERGSKWAYQVRRFKDRINAQLVLGWLTEDRIDLASLIVNMGKEGKLWLVDQTENVKNQLWPPEVTRLVLKRTETEEISEENQPPGKQEEKQSKIRTL